LSNVWHSDFAKQMPSSQFWLVESFLSIHKSLFAQQFKTQGKISEKVKGI
jgi:hypothetical protein